MDLTRYVGFYRGTGIANTDRIQDEPPDINSLRASELREMSRGPVRESKEGWITIMPGNVHEPQPGLSSDVIGALDGRPFRQPALQSSGSRSPRFHEHLAERDEQHSVPLSLQHDRAFSTVPDSPTLGHPDQTASDLALANGVRRKQRGLH